MATAPVRGDRHPPLSPECIAAEIEAAWLRIIRWPLTMPAPGVYLTRRGRVLVGADADRYSFATQVGTYNREVALHDLRDDVFHVWENMQR